MVEFINAFRTEQLPPGQGRTVELHGKRIAIFNVDGTFHAIDDTCLHQEGPLGEGHLSGQVVTCPWHAWEYDVTSGSLLDDPETTVPVYEVKIERDQVMVKV